MTMDYGDFDKACSTLVQECLATGRDLWLRPTLMAIEGHWGVDTIADVVITAYTLEQVRPIPITLGFSTLQRPSDRAQPARIKSSANYQVGRLARIEGRRRGYDEIFLAGTLSELVPVKSIEDEGMGTDTPITGRLADAFWEIVRGQRALPGVELTPVGG